MKKTTSVAVLLALLMLTFLMTSCSYAKTMESPIEAAGDAKFQVDCSAEVTRGKHGVIDDVGYLCDIGVTKRTKLAEREGTALKFADFAQGDTIRITFSNGKNFSTHNRNFNAAEIVRLEHATREE